MNWYEYVISYEASTLTGLRLGTEEQVQQHAQGYSEQLNERLNSKRSYYRPTLPVPAHKPNRPPKTD